MLYYTIISYNIVLYYSIHANSEMRPKDRHAEPSIVSPPHK